MSTLLRMLLSWRIIPREVDMEVAVTREGLLRLRPVVHCDRELTDWVSELVS